MSNRWTNTTAALVAWWIVGLLLVVITIFAQAETKEDTAKIYGFLHGITAMVLVMVAYSFVARQRANNLKWLPGSVVFLFCLAVSIVFSALTMQNALAYGKYDQSAGLWSLSLQIAGLLVLLLDNRKFDDQHQHRDDNGL